MGNDNDHNYNAMMNRSHRQQHQMIIIIYQTKIQSDRVIWYNSELIGCLIGTKFII